MNLADCVATVTIRNRDGVVICAESIPALQESFVDFQTVFEDEAQGQGERTIRFFGFMYRPVVQLVDAFMEVTGESPGGDKLLQQMASIKVQQKMD